MALIKCKHVSLEFKTTLENQKTLVEAVCFLAAANFLTHMKYPKWGSLAGVIPDMKSLNTVTFSIQFKFIIYFCIL